MADNSTSIEIQVTARDETTRVLKGVESGVIRFVGAVSAALATVRVVLFPIGEAKEFEKELLNVGKTTEYTAAQLTSLGAELKEISQRLNISEVDLAKVAAAGGQLGIGGEEGVRGLVAFTEAAARFSSVLDVTVDAAANGIGKLSNIFDVAITDAERISSLLNEVSNRSTASGEDLLDIMQRIGTAQGTLGIQQAAALAATGRDLGLTLETIGTSFNKIFLDLNTKSQEVANLIGLPVEEFARILRSDGIAALKLYLDALKVLPETQRSALSEAITGGGRIAALVTSLVNDANKDYVLLTRNLEAARDGFEGGTSAMQEQQRVLQGLDAQLTILNNVFKATAEVVGREALPFLRDLAVSMQDFLKSEDTVQVFQELARNIGSVVTFGTRLISVLTSNADVFKVLVRLLEAFVAVKLISFLASGVTAFSRYATGVVAAGNALAGLVAGNRSVITGIAAQAAEAQKAGNTQLTLAAKAGTTLNTLYSGLFASQDQLAEGIANQKTAEDAITVARERRTAIVAAETAEQRRLNAIIRSGAKDVELASLARGRSAAQAKADAALSVNANRELLRLSRERVVSVRAETAAEVAKQQAIIASARVQASAAAGAIASTSRAGIVAAAAGAAFQGFFSLVGRGFGLLLRGLGVAGLAVALLDILGLLQPLIDGFRTFFGISDEAVIASRKAAQDRTRQFEEEKKNAEELAERYNQLVEAWTKTPAPGEGALSKSLTELFQKLEIVQGKIRDLSIRDATASSNIVAIDTTIQGLIIRLDQAKAKYDELSAKQAQQAEEGNSLIDDLFPTITSAVQGDATAQLEEQKKLIESLSAELTELREAQDTYSGIISRNAQQSQQALQLESEALQQIRDGYNLEGADLIRLLETKLQAEKTLMDAVNARNKLEAENRAVGEDKLDTTEYAKAKAAVDLYTQSVVLAQAKLDEARASADIAAISFQNSVVPPNVANNLDFVTKAVRSLNVVSGQGLQLLEQQGAIATQALEAANVKLAEIEAARVEAVTEATKEYQLRIASLVASGITPSSEVGRKAIEQQNKALEEQIDQINRNSAASSSAAVKQRAEAERALQDTRRRIEQTNRLALSEKELIKATENSAVAERKKVVSLLGQSAALEKVVAAQRIVEKQARTTADAIATSYETAKTKIENTLGEAIDNIAARQERVISRANALSKAKLEADLDNAESRRLKEQERLLDIAKQRLEADGASADESERVLGNLREQFDRSNETNKLEREQLLLKTDIKNAQDLINKGQEDANRLIEKANELTKQSEAAKASNKPELAGKLAEEAAITMDKASQAAERLNANIQKLIELGGTPVKDFPTSTPRYLISDEQIDSVETQYQKLIRRIDENNVKVLEKAKAATEAAANAQSAALASQEKALENVNTQISNMADNIPGLVANIRTFREEMLAAANSTGEIDRVLKSISNTDISAIRSLDTLERNKQAAKDIEKAMAGVANSLTNKSLLDASKANFVTVLGEAVGVSKAQIEKNVQEMNDRLSTVGIDAKVSFPDARSSLQGQLSSAPFTASVNLTGAGVPAANIPGNAEGGYIQGPGTGTSDSILSWLSHGEFVMDSLTTRMFGPGFFATLQRLARGGSSALGSLFKAGTFGLPAFASGGFVGVSGKGLSEEGLGLSRFAQPIQMNLGGETITAYTDYRSGETINRVARKERLKKGSRPSIGRK